MSTTDMQEFDAMVEELIALGSTRVVRTSPTTAVLTGSSTQLRRELLTLRAAHRGQAQTDA